MLFYFPLFNPKLIISQSQKIQVTINTLFTA